MGWIRNQEAYLQKKQPTVTTTVHVVAKECFLYSRTSPIDLHPTISM